MALIEFSPSAALPPQKPTALEMRRAEIHSTDLALGRPGRAHSRGFRTGGFRAGMAGGGKVASGCLDSLMAYPFHRRQLVSFQLMHTKEVGTDISAEIGRG
jgi:hypothetical protein